MFRPSHVQKSRHSRCSCCFTGGGKWESDMAEKKGLDCSSCMIVAPLPIEAAKTSINANKLRSQSMFITQ